MYTDFCTANGMLVDGLLQCPTEQDLIFFATWRAGLGNSPGYVKSILSGLAYYFISHGCKDPTKDPYGNTLPRLARTLRGISRMRTDEKRVRPPLTTDLLKEVIRVMDRVVRRRGETVVRAALKAALSLGVYGLLRISEMVPAKVSAFDGVKDARAGDVTFYPSIEKPKWFSYHIRSSKTDVFRRSHRIRVFATGGVDCPVRNMATWMAFRLNLARAGPARCGMSHPLFTLCRGQYLTRSVLTEALRSCLVDLGHKGSDYASHSLRAGGAVSLAAAGYGSETIALLGGWKSDAYLLYLSMSNHTAQEAHRAMGSIGPGDITNADHQRYQNRFQDE